MRFRSFELRLGDDELERARAELLDRTTPDRGLAFRWGYQLGVERLDPRETPAVARVAAALDRTVVTTMLAETGHRYALSFLKTAVGPPPEVSEGVHYPGFHLDTHPAITADTGIELARVLLNLAPTARSLRFAEIDRFELARRGVPTPRSDYQVVRLPEGVATRTIAIPPYAAGVATGLRFWASAIPHVGVDSAEGHFLASYEAVREYEEQA
jgi:hypothetical protein